ncbi:MAG TPA: iron ABC transporter permease [Candidatus Limnocylindria bacterium]|nr:iron ABC transporter permease [Candidatus Limnocylindria bacterium]
MARRNADAPAGGGRLAGPLRWLLPGVLLIAVFMLCVMAGSVQIPFGRALSILGGALTGQGAAGDSDTAILLLVRVPRVLCVMLTGAALSLCGAAMQGLLRNPLADGATLGVSSGASLGAMLAILLGFRLPALPLAGTAVMAVAFAFLAMALVLSLAYALDRSLSTTTIILIGIVLTMFTGSLMSLVITFSGTMLRPLTYWTLGSLAASGYAEALLLLLALVVCGAVLLGRAREQDAFSLGEENARHVGVDVRRVKLALMAAVSLLIGVCVSVGGSIGFVGLVIPHISRALAGPAHRRLLPHAMMLGGVFLMLADLAARTLLRPAELPLGVVTSVVGSVFFVFILFRGRRRAA